MAARTLKRLAIGGFLFAVLCLGRQAQATPVVMSVNYSASDPIIHIGSSITVYMSAVEPTQQLSLSVTVATTNSITLGGFDLTPLPLNTFVYVTEGRRTWAVQYVGGSILQFGDGQLMGGQGGYPFSVADYNTITNQSFRAYTGAVLTGGSAGAQITADLGSFASMQLRDDGLGSDVGGFQNGVWSQIYTVPDLGYSISNAYIYGGALNAGVLASNAPFQSVVSFSLDGIRPDISTISWSTSKPNYNGILYISASSMGTTSGSPTSAIGRFDVETNKRGCVVDIEIVTTPSIKKLPPIFIPATAANRNGWKNWYGEDGSDVFVADNVYQARLYIRDDNGVSGVTRTTNVSVISLQMGIENITLTPSGLNSEPKLPSTIITTVNYDVTLKNDANTSIAPALSVLGWAGANFNTTTNTLFAPTSTVYTSLSSTVWTMPIERFLNPDGSVAIEILSHDFNSASDSDEAFLALFRGDFPRQANSGFTLASCYYGNALDIAETANTAIPVNTGDGDKTNDWDDVQLFQITSGTSTAPLKMVASQGRTYVGATPAEGSYRLQLRSILTGMDVAYGAPAVAADIKDKCAPPAALPTFLSMPVHFFPSTDTSVGFSSGRGRGIFNEDSSVLFTVSKTFAPTSDSTAPLVVSTDPQNGTQIQPNVYGPSPLQILSAQVQDIETPVKAENTISFIQLFDPSGAEVGGNRSTSGGSPSNQMTLYFRPFQSLRSGGTYKMVVNSCNIAGLCVSKEFTFTLQDQTAPSVVGVELVSSTQASNINLTMGQTAPDGPFSSVTEVWARLGMDPSSSNTIDWDNSVLALRKIVGGTAVVEPLTRISPALGQSPTDGRIKYRVDLPINVAGLYEVFLQTTSQDGSGQRFGGPASPFTYPRFTTIIDPNYLSILYPGGDPQIPAVTGLKTITVTTAGGIYVTPSASTIQAIVPDLTTPSLNPPVGYVALNSSANNAHALQFSVSGLGTLTLGMRYTYDPTTPVRFNLYYNDADLPIGVSETALVVLGYDGVSWSPVASATQNSSGAVNNSFTVIPPLTTPSSYAVYGIFFSSSAPNISPTPSPSPVSFASTRAFNPTSASISSRNARFYYADAAPRNVDVKVYDTAGVLIKEMSLGNGISATDIFTDPVYGRSSYFFQWDGRNDSAALVRNGLYLVRWRVVKLDGSVDTQTKLVAVVK